LQAALRALRTQVPPLGDDRMLAPDIEAATQLLRDGTLLRSVAPALPGALPGVLGA
jgi:histidine ammonia-lyase